MNDMWVQVVVIIVLLAIPLYTIHRLRAGYLPGEELLESIQEWCHKRWGKQR